MLSTTMMSAPVRLNVKFEKCITDRIEALEAEVKNQKRLNSLTPKDRLLNLDSNNKLRALKKTRDSIPSQTKVVKEGNPSLIFPRLFGNGDRLRNISISECVITYQDLNGKVKGTIELTTMISAPVLKDRTLSLKSSNRTWVLKFNNTCEAKAWEFYLKKNFTFLEQQRLKHERAAEEKRAACERAKIQAEMVQQFQQFQHVQKEIERVTRGFQQMTPVDEEELEAELQKLLDNNSEG